MFDFDSAYDRKAFFSTKWCKYGARDVLPFWVADMDFPVPDFLLTAIQERVQQHPILGYTDTPDQLVETFIEWAFHHFQWELDPDWLVWIHGVVPGLNLTVRSIGTPGDKILVPIPVYPPFFRLAENNTRVMVTSTLVKQDQRWLMDFEHIESVCKDCEVLAMCNPQNPTGRIYTEPELRTLADICLRTGTVLLSDEIHWGLTLDSQQPHLPVASLAPEYADNTITLLSHTKTYNIAGLQVAVAVIPNKELRTNFASTQEKLYGSISPLSYAAAIAAYADRGPWLTKLNAYLTKNRNLVEQTVAAIPNLSMTPVEGTHLAWLDAHQLPVEDPTAYFESFGLGLSPGADFGARQMVRFNFAAPHHLVEQGLQRLQEAASCAFS